MCTNHTTLLQALNLLESGDLAVLSFGEKPNLLHPFTEQFSEHSGSKILEQLTFEQTKTKVAQLLDFCTVLFEEQTIRSDALNAKLLVIVSDGRGIFSEGETKVIQAVRRARQLGIFLVYVIIDNPDNKVSFWIIIFVPSVGCGDIFLERREYNYTSRHLNAMSMYVCIFRSCLWLFFCSLNYFIELLFKFTRVKKYTEI